MNKITVITPVYNRKELIKRAYQSLKKQTNKNFEWLIIDDGSEDRVKEEIAKMQNEGIIKIDYIYKKNGGKHTALNIAFKKLTTELAIILDSDDTLTPNAVNKILDYWNKYKSIKNIAGMVFLRGFNGKEPMTNRFIKDEYIGNYNVEIINSGFVGDKAEVFRSSILKKYNFPEFKNEKFLAEGFLWSKIARNYDMVFINEIIYIGNYLEDGLTKAGSKLFLNNPMGYGLWLKEKADFQKISLKERIKMYFTFTCDMSSLYDSKMIAKYIGGPILLISLMNLAHRISNKLFK